MDLGATLSFITSYMADRFDRIPECILKPFNLSILVGESILAERVCRDYTMSIYNRYTMDDLVELNMVNFNEVLGMNWL